MSEHEKTIGINIYSLRNYQDGTLRCRYINCGIYEKNGFTGIVVDRRGAGDYQEEYWNNGEYIEYHQPNDLTDWDVFLNEANRGDEIEDLFKKFFTDDNDENEFLISEENFNKYFDWNNDENKGEDDCELEDEEFYLKTAAKIKPWNSKKGLTTISN